MRKAKTLKAAKMFDTYIQKLIRERMEEIEQEWILYILCRENRRGKRCR